MLAAGTQLGPYKILAPLGAGGMGEVYRARDVRLGRDVALKILPERFAKNPDRLARFEREAMAAAALDHPNILVLHDVGTDQGLSFAVMELLEGETLRKRLANPLPWRKALEFAVGIADGLAAAHAKGIIHRDLKPTNLFVTNDGRTKILDFGLARMDNVCSLDAETKSYSPVDDRPVGSPVDTKPGTVLGTAPYMSPEQVRGLTVDGRSDIFSFGCVLYEMVSGRPPFTGNSDADLAAAILHDDPPDLSGSGRKVPLEVERVIRHCLEKSPDARFQTARDLAFALRALLSDSDIGKLLPPGVRGRRPPAVRIAVAVVAVALLAGVYWLARLNNGKVEPSKTIDTMAVLPFINAGNDPDAEYLSDGIPGSIVKSLSELPQLKVRPFWSVTRYKQTELDLPEVGQQLKVQAVLTGKVWPRKDGLSIRVELVDVSENRVLWIEQYDRRHADLQVIQEEIAKQVCAKLRVRLTGEEEKRLTRRYTEDAEAYQLYLKGRYYWNKRDRPGLSKAIEYFQRAIAKDQTYALAHAGLADSYTLQAVYNYLPPLEAMPKAQEAAATAIKIDATLAEAHTSLAWTRYTFDWDWAAAEKQFQHAIDLNPRYPTAHHWYADYLTAMGRFDEAIAAMKQAQKLDPVSLIINRDMAWPHYFKGRYDEAISHLNKTLEMDANFRPALSLLGRAYLQQGAHEQALAALEKSGSEGSSIRAMIGATYAASGKKGEAHKILDDLKDRAQRKYVSRYMLAVLCVALGEKDQALDWLEQARQHRSSELVYVNVDPRFEGLRGQPRFTELLGRMNFPR